MFVKYKYIRRVCKCSDDDGDDGGTSAGTGEGVEGVARVAEARLISSAYGCCTGLSLSLTAFFPPPCTEEEEDVSSLDDVLLVRRVLEFE